MKKTLLAFTTLVALCLISCEEKRTASPTGFEARQVNNTIELTWNRVYEADEYCIENNSTGLHEIITSTSFIDENPKEGLNNYELRACGSTYGWSESVYVSCSFESGGGSSETLPAPTGFTLTQTSDYVQLSWNKVSGAAGYYALWYNMDEKQWYILEETTSTSYKDYEVTAGTTYIYGVTAIDESGNNGEIAYDQITFSGNSGGGGGGTTSKPNTPSGVEATAGSSYITVTWNSVSGADNYNVYRSTSASGTYSFISSAYSTSYTDYDVNAGTTYYYKVTAENSAGESGKSAYASAKINSGGGGGGTTSKPNTPSGVKATASSSYITVTWNSVSGADNYNVYRSISASGTYSFISTAYATSYTDYNVNEGTTYYYKVTAENSAGESGKSTYASAKINSGGGGGGGNEQHYGPVITEVSGSVSGNYITVKWKTKSGSGWGWDAADKIEVYIHDPIGNETYDGWGWRVDGTYTGSSVTSGSHTISGYYTGYRDEYGSVKIGIKAINAYGSDIRQLVYMVDGKKWYY